ILFGLWVLVSGNADIEFLALGLISTAITVWLTDRLIRYQHALPFPTLPSSYGWLLRTTLRLLIYAPWLLWEILIANLQVVYLVLHPRMPINPRLVEFDSSLKTEP